MEKHLANIPLILVLVAAMLLLGLNCAESVSPKEDGQAPEILAKTELPAQVIQEYYDNGQLKSECTYKNGQRNGPCKEWWETGQLWIEGTYVDGKANGLMKRYHEQGHLAGIGPMKDDQRDGLWKVYSLEEGKLSSEVFFKAGKAIGSLKTYHANGQLSRENTWKNDKIISHQCWDDKGNEIACD